MSSGPSRRQTRELQKLHSDGAAGLQRRRTAPLSERLRRLFHSGPAQAQSAGGGRHLEPVCSDPNVYLVHHFLSASELEHLDGLITDRRGSFKQSVTDDAAGGTSSHVVESQERTSASLHLPKGGDTSLRAIEARAAELVGLPSDYVEPLQVVTYTNGQRFDLHHDSGSLHYEDGGEEVITVSAPQGPKRLVTPLACLACNPHCTCTAPACPRPACRCDALRQHTNPTPTQPGDALRLPEHPARGGGAHRLPADRPVGAASQWDGATLLQRGGGRRARPARVPPRVPRAAGTP